MKRPEIADRTVTREYPLPASEGQARIREEPFGRFSLAPSSICRFNRWATNTGVLVVPELRYHQTLHIAKFAQLRPGRDGGWCPIRKGGHCAKGGGLEA